MQFNRKLMQILKLKTVLLLCFKVHKQTVYTKSSKSASRVFAEVIVKELLALTFDLEA